MHLLQCLKDNSNLLDTDKDGGTGDLSLHLPTNINEQKQLSGEPWNPLKKLSNRAEQNTENNHISREESFKGLVCLYHPSPVTLCLEGPPSKKGLPLPRKEGFPCGSAGKESACNAGDLGSISGLGRSPGEGRGYRLQYSGLENSMECIVHGVAKSRT